MPEVSNGSRQLTGDKQAHKPNRGRFVPGDPRINRSGRPKSFEQARELAQEILHRQTLTGNGRTLIEEIFSQWAKDPKHQLDLIQYAVGKVPDKLEATGLENKPVLILHYGHQRKNNGAH